MKKWIILICIAYFPIVAYAQQNEDLRDLIEEINEKKRKVRATKETEIGINLTQLITQFVPFNESVSRSGPFALTYRSGRGNKRFNLQVGARIHDENENTDNYFNLAIGSLKRRAVGNRFNYYMSYNGFISTGSFNGPNDQFNDEVLLGFGLGFGFEYKLSENVKLMAESMLVAGVTDGEFTLNVLPPVGLFFIVNFNRFQDDE